MSHGQLFYAGNHRTQEPTLNENDKMRLFLDIDTEQVQAVEYFLSQIKQNCQQDLSLLYY